LLLVTSVYPSARRPTKGTFNREMVTALRCAGDDVRVVVPVPWTDLFRPRTSTPAAADTTYATWVYPPRIAHATHHRWMAATVLRRIRRLVGSWTPDIVLGYWAHPDGAVALAAARELGVPGALLVGGSDIQLLTRDPARRAVIMKTLLAADRIFAVGAPLRRAVVALGVPAARVAAFERGVDRDKFSPGSPRGARERLGLPTDRPIMLWVGRMVPVKGLDILLKSWPAAARHIAHPLLILIGDGQERASLERQAAAFGDTVQFVGDVAHDALPDWYRAADCVVLPSRSEGVPNVLLEGLACGTPFVASAVGGIVELRDSESVTVPAEDSVALIAALLVRLEDPPMTRRSSAVIVDRNMAVAALRSELIAMLDTAPAGIAAPTP
jgi:glycosyltransferase involved in cell wall biosynthesis